jgi:hypothetical protein
MAQMSKQEQIENATPYVKSRLIRMCHHEINVQSNNHAGFVGQRLVNELDNNRFFNLADMEVFLRDFHNRIYLLALPVESFGREYSAFLPGKDEFLPYGLWVCMNGKAEAEETMRKHGLTEIDNKVRLHSCGFLTIKK